MRFKVVVLFLETINPTCHNYITQPLKLMPPAIVLFLYTCFVVFLLKKEKYFASSVSGFSWIPTMWMLYFAGKPLGRWFNPKGAIVESPEDRFFLLSLMLLGLIMISKRGLEWGGALRRNGWFTLLLAYMLLSCLWSDEIFSSFKQWVRVFGTTIMSLVILTERDPREALQSIFFRTVIILIPLSVILIKYFPDLGVEYRSWNGEKFWVGAALQKNGLGRLCLFSAVFISWRLINRWTAEKEAPAWKYESYIGLLLLFFIGWMLMGSGSNLPMTAIGVLALCVSILMSLLLINRSLGYPLFTCIAAFTVLSALSLTFMSITGVIPSLGNEAIGRDTTFTGRTYIWAGLRSIASDNLILGVGYSGFWAHHHIFPIVGDVNEGHNGYLDVLVETGIFGIVLLLIIIVSYARRANYEKAYDYPWACLKIVILFMLLIHNFTETSLLRSSAHLWVVFIYMYIVSPVNVPQNTAVKSRTPKKPESVDLVAKPIISGSVKLYTFRRRVRGSK